MKKNKKRVIVIVGVIAALLGVSVAAGVIVRNVNAQVIPVVPVESLAQDMDEIFFGGSEDALAGQVTDHATQEVRLTEDAIVSDVYVRKGDHVNAGDRLMSYDTTLKEMELEIERLVKQQNEQKLAKAQRRLASLQNGGPIEEDEDAADDSSGPSGAGDDSDEDGDNGSSDSKRGSFTPVSAFRPVAVRAEETPTGTPEPTGTVAPTDPTGTPEPETTGPYKCLDYDSNPFAGEGTRKSPFLFWGDVNAEGFSEDLTEEFLDSIRSASFLCKMAGYDRDGREQLAEEPYYYRIVFYENNDMDNPPLCTTSRDLQGELPTSPEPTGTPGDDSDSDGDGDVTIDSGEFDDFADFDDYGDSGSISDSSDDDDNSADGGSKLTRDQAIRNQKKNIQSLQIEIRENSLSISKLEKEVANQTVKAAMDGVVAVAGEPGTVSTGDDVFLRVDSDEGLYIRGGVSEMQLDQIDIGQTIEVNAYESGTTTQAEIRDISIFPEEGGSEFYMMGNPNVSYYSFTAVVHEKAELVNGESVSIKLLGEEKEDTALNIEVAFVREENGVTFVYKDDNGRLKRQPVDAMKNPDGYTVAIHSGLSLEDKIAFPYGKGVKNGAPTKEGTLDEVYGYY